MSRRAALELKATLEETGWAARDAVGFVPVEEETTLFRLCSKRPRERDFLSHYEKGRVLDEGVAAIQMGLSMWETADMAVARASRSGFVCRLTIPPGKSVVVAKTFGPGHYTVWGLPPLLTSCVSEVRRFDR
jgi:hypothetical protein